MPLKKSYKNIFLQSDLNKIISDFKDLRIDAYYRWLEAKRKKGRILPFVRGLKLSASLIYNIRTALSGTELTANWGHILNDDSSLCSPECDVIIHKKCPTIRWNGTSQPVMDFHFVDVENVKAVISCKSYLIKSQIDKTYPKSLTKYTKNTWLFAECCNPEKIDEIRVESKKHGYKNFWYLYTWDKKTNKVGDADIEEWKKFHSELQNLVK